MKASSLNKKLKLAIVTILSLTIVILAANAYLSWKSGQKLKDAVFRKKESENTLAYLRQVEKQYYQEKAESEIATNALPTTNEVSGFLKDVADFARKTGVSVKKLDFPETKKKDKIANFQTKMEIEAENIAAIENVIKKIEANQRILDITDIRINDNEGSARATVGLKAYYKTDEQK